MTHWGIEVGSRSHTFFPDSRAGAGRAQQWWWWFVRDPQRLHRRVQKVPVTQRIRETPNTLAVVHRNEPPISHTSFRFLRAGGLSRTPKVPITRRPIETPNTLALARRKPLFPTHPLGFYETVAIKSLGFYEPVINVINVSARGSQSLSRIINVSAGGRRKSPLPEAAERPPMP